MIWSYLIVDVVAVSLPGIKNQSCWFLRCWYVQEPASATLLTGGIFKPLTAPLYCQEIYIISWSVLLFWNTLKILHLHINIHITFVKVISIFFSASVTVASVSLLRIKNQFRWFLFGWTKWISFFPEQCFQDYIPDFPFYSCLGGGDARLLRYFLLHLRDAQCPLPWEAEAWDGGWFLCRMMIFTLLSECGNEPHLSYPLFASSSLPSTVRKYIWKGYSHWNQEPVPLILQGETSGNYGASISLWEYWRLDEGSERKYQRTIP